MSITYLDTQEARRYVGNNPNDFSDIDDVVAAVSRLIDNYCGDFFGTLDDERTFTPVDGVVTFGVFSPLVSVDTADAPYVLVAPRASAEPQPHRQLTTTAGSITIDGTWGWPEVPKAVKQACRLQVARVYKRQDSPLGVAGFGEFGVVRVSQLDPDVKSLLQPYIRGEHAGIA